MAGPIIRQGILQLGVELQMPKLSGSAIAGAISQLAGTAALRRARYRFVRVCTMRALYAHSRN
jgi:hypothetical protein